MLHKSPKAGPAQLSLGLLQRTIHLSRDVAHSALPSAGFFPLILFQCQLLGSINTHEKNHVDWLRGGSLYWCFPFNLCLMGDPILLTHTKLEPKMSWIAWQFQIMTSCKEQKYVINSGKDIAATRWPIFPCHSPVHTPLLFGTQKWPTSPQYHTSSFLSICSTSPVMWSMTDRHSAHNLQLCWVAQLKSSCNLRKETSFWVWHFKKTALHFARMPSIFTLLVSSYTMHCKHKY